MEEQQRTSLRTVLLVSGLFWLAAKLGFVFSDHGYLTPVWPPAAVALAAAVRFGPLSLVGAALYIAYDFVSVDFSRPIRYAWAMIEPAGLLTAGFICAKVARVVGFDGRLATVRSVLLMVVLALLYAAVNGALITSIYCGWVGTKRCANYGWPSFWAQAATGDVFGCLICMAAVSSWFERLAPWLLAPLKTLSRPMLRPPRWTRAQLGFVLVSALGALAAWWVTRRVPVPVHVVGYLALPLLVWAALKFPAHFVHTVILATGLVTISLQLTADSQAVTDPVTHIASLFLFLLSASALTLLISVVVQQQNALATALAFRMQQERVELMLQAATDAVISFDEQGRLTYWNPAAERIFGVASDQALGRPVHELLPIARLAEAGEGGISALCEAGDELFSGQVMELQAIDAVGQPVPVEVALTPYRNGREWNATAFVRDARAHKRQEEALRQAKEKAEEATRVKSLFLATMSHELRTPLSGVIGMLQLSLRNEMPPQPQAQVKLALSNAESLLAIINDILDYSKIEAGKMSFEQVDFDVLEMVQALNALLDLRAQEKGLSLLCKVDPGVPRWLRSDPVRLRQILFNLIGNALKFTERGFVEVRLACHPADDGSGSLRLQVDVQDTGIGIPKEAQQRLFRSFEQADVRTTRKYGGTGLGLTISKSLVDGLGGEINLRSRVGEGTCFSFWLPVQPGEPVRVAEAADAGPFDCRLKILCAEDGHTNQMIVRAFVEEMGHEVVFVENGHQAVQGCAAERFDLVLMDGRMPVMDGLEAARAIRRGGLDDAWVLDPQIWIIALTANATAQDREQCLAAGMDDFLAKPVDERQLAEALHRAVHALRERGRALAPRREASPALSAAGLDALLGLDAVSVPSPAAPAEPPPVPASLQHRLRDTFRAEAPKMMKALCRAVAEQDWDDAGRLAHNLKGSARYVRSEPIAELAERLEHGCDRPPPEGVEALCEALQREVDSWLALA